MISAIADPHLTGLAAHGLDSPAVLPRHGWDARLDAVFGHGLAGLLAAAHVAGLVTLRAPSADRLAARLDGEALTAVRLEAELIRLGPHLERWGAVVLKGAVLAHEAYPDPGLRPFTDLDLLVVPGSVRDAIAELHDLGYERPRPDPCPRFAEHVAKATLLVHPAGLAVDLHRTLVAGELGARIDVAGIVSGRRVAYAGHVAVPAPAWDAHLIEVALHAVVGDRLGRAISLRDVAQVAAHPDVDGERVIALAGAWRVDAAVALALRAAQLDLGAPLPRRLGAWAADQLAQRPPVARAPRRPPGGVGRRVTRTRALLAPTPTFLRWRYGEQPLAALYRRRWHELRTRPADARG